MFSPRQALLSSFFIVTLFLSPCYADEITYGMGCMTVFLSLQPNAHYIIREIVCSFGANANDLGAYGARMLYYFSDPQEGLTHGWGIAPPPRGYLKTIEEFRRGMVKANNIINTTFWKGYRDGQESCDLEFPILDSNRLIRQKELLQRAAAYNAKQN